jgi:hypothetical protein
MKTLKFNKNSWHYFIATRLGPLSQWRDTTDFCAYVRAVLVGMIWALALVVIAGALLYCGVCWTIWIIDCIKAGHLIKLANGSPELLFSLVLMLVIIVAAALGAIYGVVQLQEYLRDKRRRKYQYTNNEDYVEPPPSFIKHAYLTFKEKTCFKVELGE